MPRSKCLAFWVALNVAVPVVDEIVLVDGVPIFAEHAERSLPIRSAADIAESDGLREARTIVIVSLEQFGPEFLIAGSGKFGIGTLRVDVSVASGVAGVKRVAISAGVGQALFVGQLHQLRLYPDVSVISIKRITTASQRSGAVASVIAVG